MMTAINGVMLAAGSSLAALIVVKVTIVAALGLAATWLARRSRAAVRHALLAVTFGAILVLPIASIVAPPVHVTVPVAEMSRAAWPVVVNTTAPIPPVTTAADGARLAPAAPQQSSTFSLSVLLLTGWIVGTAVFLVPVMTGLWQIRSLRRSGLPWLEGQSIAETLALDAGIHRRVEVLLHEALPGPITCGVLGPAIVLPRDAESWAREDLSRAIVHELEHVRRGDSATRCLARAVCALYWFHPLVWIAWHKLVLEAERSCDDAVLKRSEATAYADQLVGLAKRLPTAHKSPLLAMASRSDLSARVGAVLDSRQRRGRAGVLSLSLACSAAVALVVAVSPLALVGAPQASSEKPSSFEVVSIRPAVPIITGGGANGRSGGPPGGDSCGIPRLTMDAGRLNYSCVSVTNLIVFAYGVRRTEISGPDWLSDLRPPMFDVLAKLPAGATQAQLPQMFEALLAERFKLAVHRGSAEVPGYALVVDKSGLKLKGVAADGAPAAVEDTDPAVCPPQNFNCAPSIRNIGGVQTRTTPVTGQVRKVSNPRIGVATVTTVAFGKTRLEAPNTTLAGLADVLSTQFGWPMADETRASGRYEVLLEISMPPLDPGGPPPTQEFLLDRQLTAYRDALLKVGLRLEPRKVTVETIVVDHAEERPTEN